MYEALITIKTNIGTTCKIKCTGNDLLYKVIQDNVPEDGSTYFNIIDMTCLTPNCG